ncbi:MULTISPECIES: pro-sigmaK processing inhibitor BofA family protein [Sediminibacillus]|uniref:pro-sigmaK processing inhibitor BofA family protein n=1 Tax=Sediminibacillus TaxID=482460 RepID=UPI0003FF8415|nr:pro-sigmaK processing inhibitor BofA family protein [Sediminibacillus terrae]
MNPAVIITSMVVVIALLLVLGAPIKPLRFVAQGSVKLVIGVLFLFFFNVFGASIGLHLPINIYTALITGFLGIPGLASLAAIHLFIF